MAAAGAGGVARSLFSSRASLSFILSLSFSLRHTLPALLPLPCDPDAFSSRVAGEERAWAERREWLRLVLVVWRVVAAGEHPDAAAAAATHPHVKVRCGSWLNARSATRGAS